MAKLYNPFVLSVYCGRKFYLLTVDATDSYIVSLTNLLDCIKKDSRAPNAADNTGDADYIRIQRIYLDPDGPFHNQASGCPSIEGRQFISVEIAANVCQLIMKNKAATYAQQDRAFKFYEFFKNGEFATQVNTALGGNGIGTAAIVTRRQQYESFKSVQAHKGLFFSSNGLRRKPSAVPAWERPLSTKPRV